MFIDFSFDYPTDYIWPIILAGGMVVLTGLIDDIKEITQ